MFKKRIKAFQGVQEGSDGIFLGLRGDVGAFKEVSRDFRWFKRILAGLTWSFKGFSQEYLRQLQDFLKEVPRLFLGV